MYRPGLFYAALFYIRAANLAKCREEHLPNVIDFPTASHGLVFHSGSAAFLIVFK